MQTDFQSLPTRMRFVICDLGGGVGLCCPVCGFEYIHPDRAVVEQGRTRSQVTNETTIVTATDRELIRGSLMALRFHCENGHGFEYEFQFLKGNVFCALSAWEIGGREPPKELWRN